MKLKPYGKLTVYSSTRCPDCHAAKRFLADHGVVHELVEIDRVDGAAERLEAATGKKGVPYFLFDEERWVRAYVPGQGFDRSGMMRLLGLSDRA